MAEDKIMSGCMDSVPPVCPSTIRVFFSSTFTDMSEERNLLMREAVPELRRYCHQKGFDFEVVDMRWGIREDAASDHTTVDIVLKEIENCQKISAGPNFVLFVGDKYGSRTLPNAIPVTEFRLFRRIASWLGLKFEIVEKWYLLDTNTVPHVYRMLPITTLLPYYGNLNPVNQGMRKVHQQNWECDERNIRNVLRKVATVAVQQNKITEQDSSKYFISVTENEIEKGVYTYAKVQNRVIYFERTLININLEDKMAKRFTDLTKNGELEEDVQELREKMKTKLLPSHIPRDQIVHNALSWTPRGIDPDFDEHSRYLIMFCEAFKAMMQKQIDLSIQKVMETRIQNMMTHESAIHLRMAKFKCSCFFGQDAVLKEIHKAMENGFVPRPKVEKKVEEVNSHDKAEGNSHDDGLNAATDQNGTENENLETNIENDTNRDDGLSGDKGGETDNQNGDIQKVQDNEEDENANDSDSEMNEEDEELEKLQNDKLNEIEQLRQTYANMKNGPTFATGEMANESGSDPSRSTREELTSFKRTRKTRRPVVLYGPSGSGKTAIISKIGQMVKMWNPNVVLIIRFLGTSTSSGSVRPMIISIIHNIWMAYKVNRPMDLDFNSDMIYLGQYLQALIWQVSSPERPLYILLDSLDQLSPSEQAHSLAWMPTILPQDCAMVVSILPDTTNCLDSARRILRSERLFVQVPALTVEAADKIISAQCNSRGREVTRPQRNFLLDRFRECPSPLYLQLTLNQALQWRSHQQVKDLILGSDVYHAINHLFMKTERNHGIILVSKAFGYMTTMRQGISALEMDDMLSLDNEALQDTFIFHLPPDPKHIRIPNSLWSQIMADVKDCLAMELVSGRMLQKWYHKYIIEVAEERYLTEETRPQLHRLVAQYFMGYWHGRNKPLSLFKGKIGWYPENTREVPEQLLVLQDGSLNLRKLAEMPHHLALAGMWREFHAHVTTDISWLVAKVKAFGVPELKADLLKMLNQRDWLSEEMVKDKEDKPVVIEEEKEGKDGEKKSPRKSKDKTKKKKESSDEDEKNNNKNTIEDDLIKMYNQIGSDLFITESTIVQDATKGEDSAEKGETEKVEGEEEDEGEGQNDEKLEEEYILDLATALRDLEILIDIVTLGVECIRQNPNNLPVQITCQLGKSRALTPGLKKLVADCYEWMEENEMPLLVPQDACMPPPGEMLQTTLSADVHLLGADRMHDHPVKLSMADNYLYVLEQAPRKYDTLRVLDLNQGGEYVMVEDVRCYVHSLRFNDNEKFIILRVYEKPDAYNASFYCRLYEQNRLAPYTLDKRAKHMDVSKTGDLVAYADDHICFICSPQPETLTLHIIYRLHHQEILSSILFSPDAYYLLTFIPGDGFKVWVPRRGESTLTIEGSKKDSYTSMACAPCSLHYITANHRLLQVLSSYREQHVIRVYNLSSGEIIHTLVSPELTYRIDMLEVDKGEEFALVATEDTGVFNNKSAKSALLWDLETGGLASRITSSKPFSAIKLLVHSKTIYVLAALWRDPVITVYNLGTIHRPVPGAKIVRQIHGHSMNILQMELAISPNPDAGGDRLISVAADNTIRVWDLKQVLTPALKAKTVDHGAIISLVYTKEADAVYLATDKGMLLRQCTATGQKSVISENLGGMPHFFMLSKNGRLLIVAVYNKVFVYYIETGELEYSLESCSEGKISCLAESGNVLVAGHSGMEGYGRIWDLSNGKLSLFYILNLYIQ
ncbi:leucine-rich repeat and WD repeat-containing protein [Plakobranchus ocellatus]|uniref:Leucine-rich repeat and WD repeat-containing protein n=1 Tax=Plakobranchus ocellatus TaxID=259542 RepID=A0AAV4AFA5_9GAST|nr:leucine-rich repeat and WD repeat-containing protein [Plakobranchus ocellatus]